MKTVLVFALGAVAMFLLTSVPGAGAAGEPKPEAGGTPLKWPPVRIALPATGQTLCYDTKGNVIDCDNPDWPGQDGFYRAGCSMEGRFVDNGDGTVTDRCTGLMWQKVTALGRYNWKEALQYCDQLQLAGHTDWRLPNVLELQSIVNYGRFDLAIDPVFGAVSSGDVSSWYWSSSTRVGGPGQEAWGVHFNGGGVTSGYKTHGDYVRAVRG